MSKVLGDVISDNFCVKNFPPKTTQRGSGVKKIQILAFGANSTKFCIHNLGAYRELEIQKLTTQNDGGGGG